MSKQTLSKSFYDMYSPFDCKGQNTVGYYLVEFLVETLYDDLTIALPSS